MGGMMGRVSCRLRVLLPKVLRMSARPSARPLPKLYTHWVVTVLAIVGGPFDRREIGDFQESVADVAQQPQTVLPQVRFRAVDRDRVEKRVDRGTQAAQHVHRADKI